MFELLRFLYKSFNMRYSYKYKYIYIEFSTARYSITDLLLKLEGI